MRLSFSGFLCTLRCNLSRQRDLSSFPIIVSLRLSWFSFPLDCCLSSCFQSNARSPSRENRCQTGAQRAHLYRFTLHDPVYVSHEWKSSLAGRPHMDIWVPSSGSCPHPHAHLSSLPLLRPFGWLPTLDNFLAASSSSLIVSENTVASSHLNCLLHLNTLGPRGR